MGVRPAAAAVLATALLIVAAAPVAAAAPAGTGYDVSYPQCGGTYPSNPAFGIVGVNGGIVYSANPCAASEIAWGGGAAAALYANTGDPGPALSSHWPDGQTAGGVTCTSAIEWGTTPYDNSACAYVYGWQAAADSYADAVGAYAAAGLAASPAGTAWWLDVETSNSWRTGDPVKLGFNIADLQGAVNYLRSVGVVTVGFYSTAYQWGVITGPTSAFSASASWIAGSTNLTAAKSACAGPSFTGGPVALAQFPSRGFDGDIACSGALPPTATSYTLAGPAGGLTGTASGSFTVTPNGPYTGTITVTPTGGGLATATVLTFAGSAAPQTFAITPVTIGPVTLTPSNDGGLADSPALAYATEPGAPTGVVATAGDGSATVSWTPPADGGSAITGYAVASSPAGPGCATLASATGCTLAGLANGTTYTFTVTATNGYGTGVGTASNAVTPSATAPAATTLAYTGPTTLTHGKAATLSAKLTTSSGTAIGGATVSFAFGGGTYTGTTGTSGSASVRITAPKTAGSYALEVSFAGTATYAPASATVSIRVR